MKNSPILFFAILILCLSQSISKNIDKAKKFLKSNFYFQKFNTFLEENEADTEKGLSEGQGNKTQNDTNPEEDKQAEESEEEEPDIDESESSKVNVKCVWANSYNVYSLEKLQKKKNGDYQKNVTDGDIVFNFCQNTNTKTDLKSSFLWKKKDSYIKIAGSIEGSSSSKNIWSEFKDEINDQKGILISLADGDECKSGKNHTTYLKIICDDDVKKEDFLNHFEYSGFSEGNCIHIITFKSRQGCTLTDFYLLKRVFNKCWYLFGFLFLGIGGFLCFYGHILLWFTNVLVTSLFCCFVINMIVLNFIPSLITTELSLWILIIISLLIGVVVGVVIKKLKRKKEFSAIIGACMGYTLGIFLYQIIQVFISWNPQIIYYIIIIIFVIAGILFGYFIKKSALILGTVVLGAYIAIRGVITIFGQFVDEGQFVDLIKSGETEQLKELKNGWTFLYLGLWLLLMLGGAAVQCHIFKKNEEKEEENNW